MTSKRIVISIARIALSLAILLVFIFRMYVIVTKNQAIVDTLSYFTYESNLFAAAVFGLLGFRAIKGRPIANLQGYRGAATAYLLITGIIFNLLLNAPAHGISDILVNVLYHHIAPLYVAIDFVVDTPKPAISYRRALLWVVYPIAYMAYTFIRGAITNWYPYPFFDAAHHSVATISTNVVGLIIFGLILFFILSQLSKRVPSFFATSVG
ncbi:MAG: Pr6Pr family membrane protein [Actinomycetota bacterium]|nr:Pr6Pr family membrane protein [Actinomycetota bacterium]